jgi:acetyltransferase-like isoleucine patch superfamily enzyme
MGGSLGKISLKFKMFKSWFLHSIAYSSPLSNTIINMQRARGVKIGKNCHFSSNVLIDLVYPSLVSIGDCVTISHNVMIFAHANPTANLFLKKKYYPRKVNPVKIKNGAVINPGSIITSGVTIGENSMISVGSVVVEDVPDNCVVVGNPARIVKKIF